MKGTKASVAFIFVVVVINMLGVGLAWPILPKLVQSFEGGNISSAAFQYGLLASAYALAQFLFSPLMGNLSDAFGRRPVLLLSQTGLAIDYAILAVAPDYWWLLAARLISGVLGATITTANAYMADISTPQNRARNFGLVGAAFGIGFIAGPALGGLLGEIDIRLPFVAAALLSLGNTLYGYFLLPESLDPSKRRPVGRLWKSNPVGALANMTRFPVLLPLFLALFLTAVAARGLEAIWVLYTDFRFGWTLRDSALSLAFVGVMFIIVQGLLVGPSVRLLGERRVVLLGYFVAIVALFLFGIAERGWMLFPLTALYIVGGALAEPALKAICSRTVPDDYQGLLQGVLASIGSVAIIAGPLSASMMLAHVSGPSPIVNLPGIWFLVGALLFLIALASAARRVVLAPAAD
ncbi:TCR/Tet family MFS transporter [Nitratireductor sp. XY-223]|uniref:TCR/Tet family MFS transporter n=1 Tax=Nitratireductor sp. XY-223 TaxID=2561926 RepID=UPI0010AB34A7|nr:TCR/Tet family MFS transporter [Nitratireductor sp. XY-223]